ncbi:unnamed protein product [Owenia fusiformis]|uniref:Uncharacterized protein n=1 Tax=Owenia fusiformis TaxID=6347 RepID=A0A8S4PDE2_OWEFU|nr:unnamed protein product [Owenia fusiformis]
MLLSIRSEFQIHEAPHIEYFSNAVILCVSFHQIDRRKAFIEHFIKKGLRIQHRCMSQEGAHPSVMTKLRQIEDSMRVYGYSTLRIGIGVIFSAGFGIYIFRDHIRGAAADEVSNVASKSLEHEAVIQKAEDLAKALLHAVLTDPPIKTQSVNFLRDIFSRSDTQEGLIDLLLHALNDPKTKQNFVRLLIQVVSQSLNDDVFRQNLVLNINLLLKDDNTRITLLAILKGILADEEVKSQTKDFIVEVLSSDKVKNKASDFAKAVLNDVVKDDIIRKDSGDAMWAAFTYSVTPRIISRFKRSESIPKDEQSKDESIDKEKEVSDGDSGAETSDGEPVVEIDNGGSAQN